MGVRITPARADQAEAFLVAMGGPFGFEVDDEARTQRFADTFEWDRSRAAWDGDEIVGTSGAFSLEMTVPGATMACGGTTVVTVQPTHRRRGILSAMMDSHLDDVIERQEPIAALWASDSAIYGRFGYGCASLSAGIEVSRQHTSYHRLAPDPAPTRLIDLAEAKQLLVPFYDHVRRTRPGFYARSQTWWDNRRFHDDADSRDGAGAYRYVVTESDGQVTGFAQYRYKPGWADGHGAGEVRVTELIADDPSGWAGLWRLLLDHDLTAKIVADHRSVEEPLFEMLAGRRRARQVVGDGLWVRVMDPKTALEGRLYSAPADVTIEIHDSRAGGSSTWRLDLSEDGAVVSPTDAEPKVSMDIEDLGGCFMGWSRFAALHEIGRAIGARSDILALDRAFTWSPLPWCPEVF